MIRALISLASEDPDTGAAVGLAALFDGQIIDYQIHAAEKLGATAFVLVSPTMPGELLRYTDQLKQQGKSVDVVRHARDLVQYADDSDSIIFLGDAVLPRMAALALLNRSQQEEILVTRADQGDETFERIDLNHRWLGMLRLDAKRLAGLAEIPEDWDTGSAVLRLAVQAGLERTELADREEGVHAVVKLADGEAASAHVRVTLADHPTGKAGFLDRFAVWPLTRRILPKLWQRPQIVLYLKAGSWILATAAIAVAALHSASGALAALFLAVFLHDLTKRVSLFSVRYNHGSRMETGFQILLLLGFLAATYRGADPAGAFAQLTIALLLALTLWLIDRRSPDEKLVPLYPDKLLILLVLLVFSGVGLLPQGLSIAALFAMIYLVLTLQPWKSLETADSSQQ